MRAVGTGSLRRQGSFDSFVSPFRLLRQAPSPDPDDALLEWKETWRCQLAEHVAERPRLGLAFGASPWLPGDCSAVLNSLACVS